MKNFLPLLLGLIGIVALCAAIWILFSGEENNSELPDLLQPDEPERESRVVTGTGGDRTRDRDRETVQAVGDPRPVKELIIPELYSGLHRGKLIIRVIHEESGAPAERESLRLSVFFNDIPFNGNPQASDIAGEYVLDNLLPGRYRIDAATTAWEKGSATVSLAPESQDSLVIHLAPSDHLSLQVVDAVTLEPIQNARIQARGFIQGGLTDKEGYFQSARKFVPDSTLTVQISHPSYFTLNFEPLHPKKSGAERAGGKNSFRILLAPLKGELYLSGMVIDKAGNPVQRLALFLSPDGRGASSGVVSTYTDRSGFFRFDRLQPGTYKLSATLRFLVSRYMQNPPKLFERVFTLLPRQNLTDQIIEYDPARYPLNGYIYLADTYEPAAGAKVKYVSTSRQYQGAAGAAAEDDPYYFDETTTDEQGAFRTQKLFLPEDIYRMIVYGNIEVTTKRGYTSVCRPRKTPEGLRLMQADILQSVPLTLWIVEEGDMELSGRIVDDQGLPLSGARVTADSSMDIAQGRMRGYSDEAGYFKVSHLFPGKWILSFMIPKGPTIQRTVLIPDSGTPPMLNVKLETSCILEGQILTDRSPGRWNIRVQGLDYETESQKIGASYWYSFKHLPPGRAKVILEIYEGKRYQESYLDVKEEWVELAPGKTLRVDFSI
jgi:protocatechuate 3,4-dioxygenase beta subunit